MRNLLIQMLESRVGCNDGFRTIRYCKGQICGSALVGKDYISDSLARDFLRYGYARLVSCRRLALPGFLRELRRVPTNPQTYLDGGKHL